jgi:hypothetical protein
MLEVRGNLFYDLDYLRIDDVRDLIEKWKGELQPESIVNTDFDEISRLNLHNNYINKLLTIV